MLNDSASRSDPPQPPGPAAHAGGLRRTAATAWHQLRREPLVHFTLIAGLIFGVNAWLHPPSESDRVITVTADLQRQIREQWDEDRERHPTPEQVQQMVDLWVASEVLYREGKTMGLDRGDEMIRTRVAHKLQIMIFGDVRVSSPTESQIREWYAQNRWRYDTPEKVSFYLAPAASEAEANRFLTEMEAGKEPEELQQSARAFIGRPSQSIAVSLGQPFLDRLLALPHGQWHAIQSKEGWHVARLDEVVPAVIVPIESVLSQAIEQWKTDETRRQALEALARLRSKYTIRYEPAA